ncbi:hypothetical protein KC19_10G054300 [Ceratodon purpureus]|uniref:Uncharacterized protein n=1 Tax=Ceratodon purpureus TaxID=3225 RepID=A0A8T0GKM6_CERPU|nr:hypothetical protein KC19_10G054300 [Ceratodon purpureus]
MGNLEEDPGLDETSCCLASGRCSPPEGSSAAFVSTWSCDSRSITTTSENWVVPFKHFPMHSVNNPGIED